MKIRRYSELLLFDDIEGRYQYLKLGGSVGKETFGYDRFLNQTFYKSKEWRDVRDYVIVRDNGCDLGVEDYPISDKILIHHMNPMTPEQLEHGDPSILDPEFLISCTHQTHNAIHYGDLSLLPMQIVERRPGDTRLW